MRARPCLWNAGFCTFASTQAIIHCLQAMQCIKHAYDNCKDISQPATISHYMEKNTWCTISLFKKLRTTTAIFCSNFFLSLLPATNEHMNHNYLHPDVQPPRGCQTSGWGLGPKPREWNTSTVFSLSLQQKS